MGEGGTKEVCKDFYMSFNLERCCSSGAIVTGCGAQSHSSGRCQRRCGRYPLVEDVRVLWHFAEPLVTALNMAEVHLPLIIRVITAHSAETPVDGGSLVVKQRLDGRRGIVLRHSDTY